MLQSYDTTLHLCTIMVKTKSETVFVAIGSENQMVVATTKSLITDACGTTIRKLTVAEKNSKNGVSILRGHDGTAWMLREVELLRVKRK